MYFLTVDRYWIESYAEKKRCRWEGIKDKSEDGQKTKANSAYTMRLERLFEKA